MEESINNTFSTLTKDRISEADIMVDQFKKEFREKFGLNVFVSYNIKGDYKITDISLNTLLAEINDYLFEVHPFKIIETNYRKVDISEGIHVNSRAAVIVELRHIFSHIAHKLGYNYSTIGRFLNQDHCTILHAVKNVNNMFDVNDMHYIGIYNIIQNRLIKKYGEFS